VRPNRGTGSRFLLHEEEARVGGTLNRKSRSCELLRQRTTQTKVLADSGEAERSFRGKANFLQFNDRWAAPHGSSF
jgi:hypothetical protein